MIELRQSASKRPVVPGPKGKEVEDDDPMVPMFVSLTSPPGYDGMGEMARCLVEEYAMVGFSPSLLFKMFQNPYYQALHGVYAARGEEYVKGLLASVFGTAPAVNDPAPAVNDSEITGPPSHRPTVSSQGGEHA